MNYRAMALRHMSSTSDAFMAQCACVALLAIGLASCGGGGGSVASNNNAGSIDRSGNTTGAVTGFGSVFVNGIEYDTRSATITKDGRSAVERDLRIGQIVTVSGTRNDARTAGTATSVAFDDNVEGPISSINTGNNSMVVLGQTVFVDASTVFDDDIDPASLLGLTVNQFVEVSGFVAADGSIRATFIETKPAGGELELRGVVSFLDTNNRRFNINAQVIDYANATLADFPSSGIANGQIVEVKGTTLNGNVLIATRVENKNPPTAGANGNESEIEGLITRFVSATDFDVGGIRVTTNGNTRFEDGVVADLRLNARVEVEGTVDANGVLVAEKIEIRRESDLRITANVQSLGAANQTLTILGVVIQTDTSTQFEDKSRQDERPFEYASIDVGDYLEIRGFAGNGNIDIIATRLEREDSDEKLELRGVVESVSDPTLVVLGVTVFVDATTEYADINDQEITREQFFAAVRAGAEVNVDAVARDNAEASVTATEIDLE